MSDFDDLMKWDKKGLALRLLEAFNVVEGLRVEVERLRSDLADVSYAAHMPDDYKHGLSSWINQHLYGRLHLLMDSDGRPIRRSDDIEIIRKLRSDLAAERERCAARICSFCSAGLTRIVNVCFAPPRWGHRYHGDIHPCAARKLFDAPEPAQPDGNDET